jgi:DNA-binding NarL/FixJ family response regulator
LVVNPASEEPDESEAPVRQARTDGVRVLVADTHRIFAEVLAASLSIEGRFVSVDVAFTPDRARFLLSVRHYGLLVLDPSLDVISWLRFMHAVARERPTLVVIVVSELRDVDLAIDALARGVRSWLPKDIPFHEFLHAMDEAVMGRSVLPAWLLRAVLNELLSRQDQSRAAPSFLDDLTPRQREVLHCLADGMSRAEIAEQLALSPNTVRTHVQEVLRKAGVHSTLAAVVMAREVLGTQSFQNETWTEGATKNLTRDA